MVRAEKPGSVYTYTYNGDGLLVSETVDGVETVFTWDLALDVPQVLATSDGAKNLYGLERIGVEQAGAWRYTLADALGSVRQWTDPAGGVLGVQSYGPFGEPRDPVGTPPWGFTGEWQDPAGMVYLRARWYSPTLGRFHQVDPVAGILREPATEHPYVYGLNSPVRYGDASGRFPWAIVGAAAAAAAIDYGAQVYRNRQAGLDWGAALTTSIDVREVVSAAGAGGLVAIAVPELISMTGLGLAGTALGVYGLSQTLGGGSGAIPQYLARSSAWASTGLWRGGLALGGAAQAAAEAVYGLRSCPPPSASAEGGASGKVWPSTAEEMDELLGFEGIRVPDGPYTGRGKVKWAPSDNITITYEQHPYHTEAPAWHQGPHWHIQYPGVRHRRYLPGDPIP